MAEIEESYNSVDFGKRLKKIRKQHNITQESLAEMLNVSIDSITKYETGKVNIGHDYIIKICKMFNISADYFYFEQDKKLFADSSEEDVMWIISKLDSEERIRAKEILKLAFPNTVA
ncbi:helix-turn-helix domain-containing protein [Lachnotalea glycerini]|uniref:XRE family transcriptional regulator n=1 Tax=Lachnotalea glycerini TaxID=1763509 RepID=A0A371JBZ3_9FIRM|nr:helix-turn-helix transcriptional regulator [Lachnotalea glycerini]RDY30262.1 XRE family transcriptional regulator [Lachnotalea glycerini]